MKPTTLHTLIDLVKSVPDLYLTGSYAFQNTKDDSDIDFFVSFYEPLEETLKSLGFENENVSCYKDSQTVAVYKHPEANIHVQVVKNAERKMKAQQFLLSLPIAFRYSLNNMGKSARKEIWDWSYKMTE